MSYRLVFFPSRTVDIRRLRSNFFVVLFERRQVFTSLAEFTFFHTFTNIPMDKGSLGVHEIKLVVNATQSFGNGCGVGNHAHGALQCRRVTARNLSRGLVVDAAFEASRA